MVSGIVSENQPTPDRTVYVSSRDRPVSGIKSCVSFGPSGIPKASSITRSPRAFHSEDGDFGLLDMFVDSNDFELHETMRSLRFTAAASNISNLFPQTPKSNIVLPPSSVSGIHSAENVHDVGAVKSTGNRTPDEHEQTGDLSATMLKVHDLSTDNAITTVGSVKPLTAEAVAKARLELDNFVIEPVTPPSAQHNEASGLENRRPFSLSPRSRKIFEKLSMRRDKRNPSRQEEGENLEVDDDSGPSSGPQPLSKMVSGLERLFSRISSTSRPAEQNADIPPINKSSPSNTTSSTSQRKVKAKLAKWTGDVKKFFGRLME